MALTFRRKFDITAQPVQFLTLGTVMQVYVGYDGAFGLRTEKAWIKVIDVGDQECMAYVISSYGYMVDNLQTLWRMGLKEGQLMTRDWLKGFNELPNCGENWLDDYIKQHKYPEVPIKLNNGLFCFKSCFSYSVLFSGCPKAEVLVAALEQAHDYRFNDTPAMIYYKDHQQSIKQRIIADNLKEGSYGPSYRMLHNMLT